MEKANYRSRKQVVEDCVKNGAMTEEEGELILRSLTRADNSYKQGRMYLDLKNCETMITEDFEDKLQKNQLTPTQKKTLHIIRVNNITKPHLDTVEEVATACKRYLEIMIEDGMSPTLNGLSLALGIPLKRLFAIQNGEERPYSADVIANTMQMIATSNEVAIRNSGAVGEMFVAKNYHGMTDKQEIVHTENKVEMSDEELEERYKNIIDVESK